jgi:uncharacterized protein YndB with AHSA1/START domain
MNPPYPLDRSVLIRAPRDVVFRYFTDSARFARWWGKGSTIDCRPGGAVRIVYPNAIVAAGVVERVEADRGITFTYGYEARPEVPVGGSRVTIELRDHAEGTLLHLRHELPTEAARDDHVQGWRYQLALFANAVADEQHAACAERADEWFAAWAETDADRRAAALARCASDDVRMQDAYSCLRGRDELTAHIAASQMHMPGVRIARAGAPRHCQGTALVDWVANDAGGVPRGRGTNVFALAADGRIAAVTGFWAQ